MKGNRKDGSILWKIIQAGIILLTLLGFIKGIFISLDIDESYAVTQSYRLACGDRMFVEMWESHQLSAFLATIFIKIYLLLFHTTDYLIVYLRIIGMLIHTGLGVWLYRNVKKELTEKASFLILFLHLNFLPKWVQMPEFELMHYWFLLAAFLLLYRYFGQEKGDWWRPALAGVCLVGSMMSYPTMIFAYPIYLCGLCVLERQKHAARGKQMLRSSLWFTAGAGVSGVAFLAYLFSYQTLDEFMQNVSYIFMDESHTTYTAAEKWAIYGGQTKELGLLYLKYMLVAVAIVAVVLVVSVLVLGIRKKLNKFCIRKLFSQNLGETLILVIVILTALALQAKQIVGCLLLDQNQFYFQIRYLAAILPAIYLGIRYHKRMSVFFYLCVLPALVSLPAVLVITNMNVNVTLSRAFLGVLGSMVMCFLYSQEKLRQLRDSEQIQRIICTMENALVSFLSLGLLAGFFVCRLILIRVSGCLPVTINAPLERMEAGPEKGIYVLQAQAQIWNENYDVLKDVVDKGDRLLYIGAENLIYPATEAALATPSTQGTTVFNEMFLYYYEKHPEKLPNIIVIDKTFETNPVYGLFSDSEIVLDWIAENYGDATVQETEYMKILFLED